MKTVLPALYLLSAILYLLPQAKAADGRVITENGTNIFAIGIDSRDFSVVRFYMQGTNVLELRAERMLIKDVAVRTEVDKRLLTERDAIFSALKSNTNVGPGNVALVLSNMVRLQILEDVDAKTKGTR